MFSYLLTFGRHCWVRELLDGCEKFEKNNLKRIELEYISMDVWSFIDMDLKQGVWTSAGGVVGERVPGEEGTQVRVITLHDGEHLNSSLHNVEKGWILAFRLGPDLYGKEISVYTNHPESAGAKFERSRYRKLRWFQGYGPRAKIARNALEDVVKCSAQVPVRLAGSFNYYFVEDTGESVKILGSGYFTVNPALSVGRDPKRELRLDSIQCQTVLTKCLGPLGEWKTRIRTSKESGYNAIHFTPIQELGGSDSSYSIKDQLKVNPKFGGGGGLTPGFNDILNLTKTIKDEWETLCISDVVLNHTSDESPWLLEHPECAYNMVTSPHLIPAALLDGCLHVFGRKVAEGAYLEFGIPRHISAECHLEVIKQFLDGEFMSIIRLEEFFMCDVEKIVSEFKVLIKDKEPLGGEVSDTDANSVQLKADPSLGRKQAAVDMDLVVQLFNRKSATASDENTRIADCVRNLTETLQERNAAQCAIVREHLKTAVNNCIATIRYERVRPDGPQLGEISAKYPLIQRYFTGEFSDYGRVEEEVFTRGHLVMAHNGWVMNCDPLKNFADSDSNVYLRRELVVWGDSVKLRYGESPADCPFLWDHMRKYVEKTAEVFHGIRLDNCHSTPLPVAEYMMDCARRVRPDLYILAELFTDSEDVDNLFINRLGITALVREEMRAWNLEELGRMICRYGGKSVGDFYNSDVRILVASKARAMFYDVTHDNESQIEKRSVFNCLPCAAVVNVACCASGSTRGFDELVPHKIDVVNEDRMYKSWTDNVECGTGETNFECGIIAVKKKLNLLHKMLNDDGYSEVYFDRLEEDIAVVTRRNPKTHDSIILIAYLSYSYPEEIKTVSDPKMLKLDGEIATVLVEASLTNCEESNYFCKPKYFTKDAGYINGLREYKVKMKTDIKVGQSSFLTSVACEEADSSEYVLQRFLPGSIIAARVIPKSRTRRKIDLMTNVANALVEKNCGSIIEISSKLNLEDLNFALYSCTEEGLEGGCGCYHVPGFGSLVYCGLQGFSSMLCDVRKTSGLGHPFCHNLRDGDWMMDYISERFKSNGNTRDLGLWFEEVFGKLKQLPRFLIPRYFDIVVNSVTEVLVRSATSRMSEFVRRGSSFVASLAMGSVQCIGSVKSTRLPSFSFDLRLPYPTFKEMTMSAGLPHFSSGCMRSWGRDTFVSLRGLMLLTGRYEMARSHILGYASCLRHGLIPNLLDCGVNPRYNSRDAVWWWLYSITSYVTLIPEGYKILNDPVARIFAVEELPGLRAGVIDQPLYHVMQEALTEHFKGLSFRERNAGPKIDQHMTEHGFDINIGVALDTGFVFGGNEHNCGTWMDKMGSSAEAGNRGRPATPRDGSAVELVGLCKRVLHELAHFHDKGYYPYNSVNRTTEGGENIEWTFKEWEEKIARNFDKYFWIDNDVSNAEESNSHLIHRRGIYKDTHGASQPWADYQLRCNFLVALALAPEMTDPEKAWMAIEKAEEVLLGPLGIRTLDPADWNYHGDYDVQNNSNDPRVAHGFNYHQGPEWLWPVGYFLRAKLHFARLRGSEEINKSIKKIWAHLGRLYENLLSTQWRGLPELTNSHGSDCPAGCSVQAWSMACILEVLYDLDNMEITL